MIGSHKDRFYIDSEGLPLDLLGPIYNSVEMCSKVCRRFDCFLALLLFELPLCLLFFGGMASDQSKNQERCDRVILVRPNVLTCFQRSGLAVLCFGADLRLDHRNLPFHPAGGDTLAPSA